MPGSGPSVPLGWSVSFTLHRAPALPVHVSGFGLWGGPYIGNFTVNGTSYYVDADFSTACGL